MLMEKWCQINLLDTGLTNVNFFKMQYLQSTIKWGILTQNLEGHVISRREDLSTHKPEFKSQIWFNNLGLINKPLIPFSHFSFIELSWQSALNIHQENKPSVFTICVQYILLVYKEVVLQIIYRINNKRVVEEKDNRIFL